MPTSTSGTSGRSSTNVDAKAIYASASTGAVDITAIGTGSGFVVDGQGHIVTAARVIDGATSSKVTFSDGVTRTATLAGKDDATDVAVLKVDPSGLTLRSLALGSSAGLGVGFAIPSDLVAGELGQLEAGRTVSHAYLGVGTTQSTGTTGASVGSVAAGSPAASAGLKTGDVVTAIGGKTITGSGDLVAAIAGRHRGDRIELTVRRGSSTLTLTATLGTQPSTQRSAAGG